MAGPKVFFEDGTAVPDDQVHDAVASGKAFVEQGASLNMLDETGAPVKIAAENVQHALAAGYSVEGAATADARQSRREHTTGGQMALAGAEGVARGATLGLSDAALVGTLGDDYRKGAQARQQENRLVAGVGEVAGAIGGSLATGGLLGAASAPARGAAALGRATEGAVAGLVGQGAGVLGRAGARAAALGATGAVEGSLYGAGQAVSRAALDGTELSAEKVMASMGEGAMMGGAGGAVLGGIAGSMRGAAGAVSKSKGFQQGARELANESALKAAGARGSDFRRIVGRRTGEAAEKRIDDLGQELLHYEYKTGPRQGQQLFRAAVKAEDLVDDVVYARQETGEALSAIRQKLDDVFAKRPELAPDVKAYLSEVDDQVLKPLKESNVPAIRARAAKVEEQLAILRKTVEPTYDDALRVAESTVPNGSQLSKYSEQSTGVNGNLWNAAKRKGVNLREDVLAIKNALHEEIAQIRAAGGAYEGTVYRGAKLTDDELRHFTEAGDIVDIPAFTSTSISQDVAKDYLTRARAAKQRNPTLFEIKQTQGVAVPHHFDATTKEIVLEPGKFRVVGRSQDASGTWRIQLEQEAEAAKRTLPFRELEQVRRDLREVFQPPKSSAGGIPAQAPEHAAALEQAERLLSTHLDNSAEQALAATGGDVTAYKGLKKQYSNLRDIEDLVQKADLQQAGNRAVSPSDYATGTGLGLGALLSGNVGAIGYGIAGAIAHKLIRERGRSTLAVLADSVASMNSGIDSAAKRFAGAIVDAPKRAIAPVALGAGEVAKRYATAVAAVQDFQTPEGGMARLQAPVERFSAESPALAAAVQNQVGKGYQFMVSKLPTVSSRAATSFTPDLTETRVPVPEMNKFLRYWRGITAPGQVIDDLSNGKMDRQGLEAIKNVFPETFSELRGRVMNYAAERGDQMPFQQRILLSLVFDFPGDKSMQPAYAQDVQAAYDPLPETAEPESGRTMQLSPKIADDMQTETQRIAQR